MLATLRSTLSTLVRNSPAGGGLKHGFLLLFVGIGAAQIVAVLASPVISRVYTPREFGIFAVYSSIAAILSSVATLRYETAIPLPKDDRAGGAVLLVSLIAVVFVTLASAFAVFLVLHSNVYPSQIAASVEYLWLLPLTVLGAGVQMTLFNWMLRKRAYALVARTRTWQGLAMVGSQIAFGVMHAGALGLIVGFIVGQVAGTGSLLRALWTHDRSCFRSLVVNDIAREARTYWRFPAYNTVSTLMNSMTSSVPALLLASVFGPSVAGSYSFGQRVFGLPSSLLGQSLGQVYFAEIAKDLHGARHAIYRRFQQVTRAMVVAAAALAALALSAPLWFRPLFGSQWDDAARYSQLLAPALAAGLAFSPTTNFGTFGLNSWQLGWDSFRLALLGVAVWHILAQTPGAASAVGLLSAVQCAGYLAVFYLNHRAHLRVANATIPAVEEAGLRVM